MFKRIIAFIVCVCFLGSTLQVSYANVEAGAPSPFKGEETALLQLPKPGTMLAPATNFMPLTLKGLVVHPKNPTQFDFLMDTGNTGLSVEAQYAMPLRQESLKIMKHFLTALTIPEEDLWVNLSPYEKGKTIERNLGETLMGRDLLAEDYILKQLTASVIYPEGELGKKFWSEVYKNAAEKLGTTQIPVNTFNKVWIVPCEAVVWQNGDKVMIVSSRLKVMLEEDYLAMNKNIVGAGLKHAPTATSQTIRDIVLPVLEQQVNEGAHFAQLRQMYQAMILATWYKKALKQNIISKVYSNQKKLKGINGINQSEIDYIYQQYILSFKRGAFNYIKEEVDPAGTSIPRKYFSGGFTAAFVLSSLLTVLTMLNPPSALANSTGQTIKVSWQANQSNENENEKKIIDLRIMMRNGNEEQVLNAVKQLDELNWHPTTLGNKFHYYLAKRDWQKIRKLANSSTKADLIQILFRELDRTDPVKQSDKYKHLKEILQDLGVYSYGFLTLSQKIELWALGVLTGVTVVGLGVYKSKKLKVLLLNKSKTVLPIKIVVHLLRDKDRTVRSAAALNLKKRGWEPTEGSMEEISYHIASSSWVYILNHIGAQAIPSLLETIEYQDDDRYQIILLLGRILKLTSKGSISKENKNMIFNTLERILIKQDLSSSQRDVIARIIIDLGDYQHEQILRRLLDFNPAENILNSSIDLFREAVELKKSGFDFELHLKEDANALYRQLLTNDDQEKEKTYRIEITIGSPLVQEKVKDRDNAVINESLKVKVVQGTEQTQVNLPIFLQKFPIHKAIEYIEERRYAQDQAHKYTVESQDPSIFLRLVRLKSGDFYILNEEALDIFIKVNQPVFIINGWEYQIKADGVAVVVNNLGELTSNGTESALYQYLKVLTFKTLSYLIDLQIQGKINDFIKTPIFSNEIIFIRNKIHFEGNPAVIMDISQDDEGRFSYEVISGLYDPQDIQLARVLHALEARLAVGLIRKVSSNSHITPILRLPEFNDLREIDDIFQKDEAMSNDGGNRKNDFALNANKSLGGIDLNAKNLDLQIKGNQYDVPLSKDQGADLSSDIQGFEPQIIEIKAVDLPVLLGVSK